MVAPIAMGVASSQSFDVLPGQSQAGMLMSLTANPGVVEPASDKNVKSLVGVIEPADTSFDQQPGQINVKTDGEARTLLSTLGGDIRVGDRITASSLAGVGAKTTTSAWIVGVAQASLDAHTEGAIKSTITDSKGAKHIVYVASLPLLIKVTYYSTATSAAAYTNMSLPAIIQRAADALAGKHVSAQALVLTFLLIIIGTIVAGKIIDTAIRGSFKAIGRQPLAKFVILRQVWSSFGLALVVMAVALAGGMLLLRIL